jgi:excinuclease ABC subunit C
MLDTLAQKANNLPLLPGVYIMLDDRGEVIYVGKAKKLKNRVSSYFHGDHLPKVAAMVEKVADFNVIVANSEFEALVLENSLIKRHQPHYNILLKDDKGYPFIRLDTKSEYPAFSMVNYAKKDGARYFGPYGSRGATKEIIDTISKTLLLPTCSRKFPRDVGKDRPCLNFHMGSCAGWCLADRKAEDYREAVRQAELILDGRTDELIESLTARMEEAAEELRFELAAEYRDRIRAVEGLSNRQRVISTAFADTDAVGFCRGAKSCFTVLHFIDGDLAGKDFEMISEPLEDDAEAVSDMVRQYYVNRNAWPKTVLLPLETEDMGDIERMLTESAGHRVAVEVPKRGDRARLSETAQMNAREECLRFTTAQQRRSKTLERLQKALGMENFPERIEAFDVSNLGDTGIVAAMTVHRDGKPLKRDYRKFRIRDMEIRDDYASMRQAVERRLRRYLDGDEHFAPLPDLMLIDGGETHAAAAREVADSLGLSLPIYGMVKDDRHRTRALISPDGREIGISGDQALFSLIGNIQEETHHFAIEYQRSLRNESMSSGLDKINGVGEKRRNELLKYFRTIKAVKAASFEELCAAVPKNTARAVYDYYHAEDEK